MRDFVAEVPKSHVLTLKWVMRPPASPDEGAGAPALPQTTVVREAARAVLAADGPVRVCDETGTVVGVVDDEDILRVVVGEESR